MERIKQTLKEKNKRLVCGRELKNPQSSYRLGRGALPLAEIPVADINLPDGLLTNKYKDAPENEGNSIEKSKSVKRKRQTSEDEENRPVTRIRIDSANKVKPVPKVKGRKRAKRNNTPSILDVADDNEFAARCQVTTTTTTTTTLLPSLTKKNIEKPKAKVDGNLEINNDPKGGNDEQQKGSSKRKSFPVVKSSYETNRLCNLSSDNNASISCGTFLNNIIPQPANFLGRNNPFLMKSPKKNGNAGGDGGIKTSTIFPNLSTSNLAKAAGQPKAVRATKKRLRDKDVTTGPNQEDGKKRTKKTETPVEIKSVTVTNSVRPSNFLPININDYNAMINKKQHRSIPLTSKKASTSIKAVMSSIRQTVDAPQRKQTQQQQKPKKQKKQKQREQTEKPAHGRVLRPRPQKISSSIAMSSNSRRNSTSSNSSVKNGLSNDSDNLTTTVKNKQTVNKYHGGAINRIEAGESYAVRAKRRLPNGQLQYLIEWGEPMMAAVTAVATPTPSQGTNAITGNGGNDINN